MYSISTSVKLFSKTLTRSNTQRIIISFVLVFSVAPSSFLLISTSTHLFSLVRKLDRVDWRNSKKGEK